MDYATTADHLKIYETSRWYTEGPRLQRMEVIKFLADWRREEFGVDSRPENDPYKTPKPKRKQKGTDRKTNVKKKRKISTSTSNQSSSSSNNQSFTLFPNEEDEEIHFLNDMKSEYVEDDLEIIQLSESDTASTQQNGEQQSSPIFSSDEDSDVEDDNKSDTKSTSANPPTSSQLIAVDAKTENERQRSKVIEERNKELMKKLEIIEKARNLLKNLLKIVRDGLRIERDRAIKDIQSLMEKADCLDLAPRRYTERDEEQSISILPKENNQIVIPYEENGVGDLTPKLEQSSQITSSQIEGTKNWRTLGQALKVEKNAKNENK